MEVKRHTELEVSAGFFPVGTRILTPGGLGTVAWCRMAPPSFAEVDVYSVRLDSRLWPADSTYTGTIYKAADVKAAP